MWMFWVRVFMQKSECVCNCICMCDSERITECVCVCVCERVCVCVCVCMCMYMRIYVHVFDCMLFVLICYTFNRDAKFWSSEKYKKDYQSLIVIHLSWKNPWSQIYTVFINYYSYIFVALLAIMHWQHVKYTNNGKWTLHIFGYNVSFWKPVIYFIYIARGLD